MSRVTGRMRPPSKLGSLGPALRADGHATPGLARILGRPIREKCYPSQPSRDLGGSSSLLPDNGLVRGRCDPCQPS